AAVPPALTLPSGLGPDAPLPSRGPSTSDCALPGARRPAGRWASKATPRCLRICRAWRRWSPRRRPPVHAAAVPCMWSGKTAPRASPCPRRGPGCPPPAGPNTPAGPARARSCRRRPPSVSSGGLPTEAMVAHVLTGKYAWHLPLYRQTQMLASQGIEIDRSTLACWVGFAAAELAPLVQRMREILLGSAKIAVDETPAPVLDPGRARTKTGYFWAIARDDRPWGGGDP